MPISRLETYMHNNAIEKKLARVDSSIAVTNQLLAQINNLIVLQLKLGDKYLANVPALLDAAAAAVPAGEKEKTDFDTQTAFIKTQNEHINQLKGQIVSLSAGQGDPSIIGLLKTELDSIKAALMLLTPHPAPTPEPAPAPEPTPEPEASTPDPTPEDKPTPAASTPVRAPTLAPPIVPTKKDK